MSTIHNGDTLKEVREGGNLQPGADIIPSILQNTIVPVMEVNPKLLRRINFMTGTSTATTGVLSTGNISTTKDFFLVGISIGLTKDITCDAASSGIQVFCTPEGMTGNITLLNFPILTLTAQDIHKTVMFPMPIKLNKASSAIASTVSFSAGACVRTIQIWGYFVDTVI
jgi:hypothetical protein